MIHAVHKAEPHREAHPEAREGSVTHALSFTEGEQHVFGGALGETPSGTSGCATTHADHEYCGFTGAPKSKSHQICL